MATKKKRVSFAFIVEARNNEALLFTLETILTNFKKGYKDVDVGHNRTSTRYKTFDNNLNFEEAETCLKAMAI